MAKCKFGCKEVEYLGFVIEEYGTTPWKKRRNRKPAASKDVHKELKSFLESIHHLNKFIPNLAQWCTSLRPLLSTTNKFKFEWNEDSEKAFKNILDTVKNGTENRHFVSNREKSILCDASHARIGAALH